MKLKGEHDGIQKELDTIDALRNIIRKECHVHRMALKLRSMGETLRHKHIDLENQASLRQFLIKKIQNHPKSVSSATEVPGTGDGNEIPVAFIK